LTINTVAAVKEDKNNFKAFKTAHSFHDWEVAAKEELNGASPLEKLTFKGDGWSMLPFYEMTTSPSPLLPVSGNDFLGARAWYNCPTVNVNDSKKANEKALECLREGADGVFFELPNEVDFNILLNNIDWQYCSLNFLAKNNSTALAAELDNFITENFSKKGIHDIHGAFIGNIVPTVKNNNFCFAGFQVEAKKSPVEELVAAFNSWHSSLRVAFSMSINNDFFLSIAKLRAMRMLWKKYSDAINLSRSSILIHARSLPWIDKNYQPHGNMLKGTTAAMASILGGCDLLTIEPEDPDQPMMSRVARNVSNVLREESYFSKVADPLAGSYFIEDLTNQLTEAAWKSIKNQLPK
jgi:methylmalonyl-CoA mutase